MPEVWQIPVTELQIPQNTEISDNSRTPMLVIETEGLV